MAGYTLIVWAVDLVLLVPSTSWVLNRLASRSGDFIVGNHELVGWLLSPQGILYLLLTGSLVLLGLVLQVTGLFWIANTAGEGVLLTAREALFRVFLAIPKLFRFSLTLFLVCVLCLLPLATGLGVVYVLLLRGHDINYYLTVQPPAWRWAMIAGGLWTLLWACAVGSLFLRWIYVLPVWLDGYRPIRRVFRVSWETTRGLITRLVFLIGACVAAWILAQLVLGVGLFTAAGFAVSRLSGSVHGLLFAISVYLVLAVLVDSVVAFIGMAWITCVLAISYRAHKLSAGPQGSVQTVSTRPEKPITAMPRLLRPLVVMPALAALLVASAAVSAWLLRQEPSDVVPIVIAHRAGALHAPENSLAALEIAIRQGADYAEIDVQRSFDGVVVVVHDADLMKMARDPHRIGQTEYAELAEVDIGRMFHPDFTGERLARLSDFLERAKGRIKLMIELKYYGEDPELARETLRLVRDYGMHQAVAVISLKLNGVRQVQRLAPDIPVGYLEAVGVGNLARLDVDFLAVSVRKATPVFVREARKHGLPVYVWTVNDVDKMLELIERGMKG
jgi:glycerophosphoryl diester phosphodiesterase